MKPIQIILLALLFLAFSCAPPAIPGKDAAGGSTMAVGKVSGRAYAEPQNRVQVLFNNPWIRYDECTGDVATTNVCDVKAGKTGEQTDNNADARAINTVISNLIMQSAIDVVEGYLPQNVHLDVATQNLDNNRIIEALEFAVKKGVHVRFVGNRENDEYDGPNKTAEQAKTSQFKPAKDYTSSDAGFGDIAKILDDYYPISVGGTKFYKREYFPLENGKTEYDGNYTAYDGKNPWEVNRFFYSGRDDSTSTNLTGVSDFNLVNHTGQMHHKFLLIKNRVRDSAGLPVSSNGNPVIRYYTVTGSANLTDNDFYRNNNNIIIFHEDREYIATDAEDGNGGASANGFPDMEEVTVTGADPRVNRCPLDTPTTRPCLYNTYKRQMNYLLSDYNDAFKPADAPLKDYVFASGISLDVYFADYRSANVIPRITDEVLLANYAVYFMAFSFSTSTYPNDGGVQLHEALSTKHPNRGWLSVYGLVSPDRSENQALMSALSSYATVYEYDNHSRDPDYYQGGHRLHHKVMIIDPCDANATVITGSGNWSQTVDGLDTKPSAGNEFEDPHAYHTGTIPVKYTKGTHNNEDIIIIHSREIAKIYYEKEFRYLVEKSRPSYLGSLPLCN